MHTRSHIAIVLFITAIIVTPMLLQNQYYLSVLIFAGINASIAIGLCMLMGYAGQISLGHAGFMAIGGYCSAILTRYHHVPPLVALLAGVLLTVVAALMVGLPSLRLRGHYLAMATLGFGEIIYVICTAAVEYTGGPSGFSGVPSMSVPGFTFSGSLSRYFLAWGYCVVVLILSLNIVRSRVGRALLSIHGDPTAASAMGVNVAKYKIQIFVYSAIIASIAGSMFVHHMRFVSPTAFNLNKSILFIIMIMSGGTGNLWGAVFGAVLFTLLPEFLGVFDDYDILMYGLILMVMMIFLPGGIISLAGIVRHRIGSLLQRGGAKHENA